MKSIFAELRAMYISAQAARTDVAQAWSAISKAMRKAQKTQKWRWLLGFPTIWLLAEVATSWIAQDFPQGPIFGLVSSIFTQDIPRNLGLASYALMAAISNWLCLRFPALIGFVLSLGNIVIGIIFNYKVQASSLIQFLLPASERADFLETLQNWGWVFALYVGISSLSVVAYTLFLRTTFVLRYVTVSANWRFDETLCVLQKRADPGAHN
ncbi:hypothetical protein [Lysinibacter cavernae]|uniref:Uncharacterized protein n=1 Tax=Lysinibacter cavernae TaxID=1640652 RepID=A0A7X5TU87_9MICO|nr:hypothetical protein [Lysinibacter cavernae]NIH55015.1 hypothetical protein [Lysinibacter cavernae]